MRLRGTRTDGGRAWRRRGRLDGREQVRALREIPMFAGCTLAELRIVDALMCETHVPPGRVLVREGDAADQLILVIDGRARLTHQGETLGFVEPGTCIGGREVRARIANPVTMTAETPMTVRAASTRELRSLLDAVPLAEFLSAPAFRLPVPVSHDGVLIQSPGRSDGGGSAIPRRNGTANSTVVNGGDTHAVGRASAPTVVEEIEAFLRNDGAPATDRVLAAVMFTDIVGSTLHLTSVGDGAWHALLDAHDSIVEREVGRHHGTVVNFFGDGALARFECANSAVRCAISIRDAVRDLGIDLRAGLHVGEVQLRDGDISGIAVHIANRICGLADSGRVLASRTLVDLVAGSGLAFEEAGTHTLKGVGGDWPLLAVAE